MAAVLIYMFALLRFSLVLVGVWQIRLVGQVLSLVVGIAAVRQGHLLGTHQRLLSFAVLVTLRVLSELRETSLGVDRCVGRRSSARLHVHRVRLVLAQTHSVAHVPIVRRASLRMIRQWQVRL